MIIDLRADLTGIPLIDEQHKQYMVLVNKFLAKHHKGNMTTSMFIDRVTEIEAYALEHFATEEVLMRSAKYPLYEEHLAKHDDFRNRINDLLEEMNTKEIDFGHYVSLLCKWLVDWFKIEVLDDDIKLVKFIKENNITP